MPSDIKPGVAGEGTAASAARAAGRGDGDISFHTRFLRMSPPRTVPVVNARLAKVPTGIAGLDEITFGGLPRGRATLVFGAAGCGKTLLGIEFLVRGATQFGEHGAIMSFDESAHDLDANVRSMGFDLEQLQREGKLAVDHVLVTGHDTSESGRFDLDALLLRIEATVREVNATRLLLDGLEALFAGVKDGDLLRMELQRMLRWLKERGITTVVTGERDPSGPGTRHGFEEYVTDCVIMLDHRVVDQLSTRRLRVMKYRGSTHGTNEYPFLIHENGISVIPITSLSLQHEALRDRVSSGVPKLDDLLEGQGYYRGSTVLLSGVSGTGKSSLAAHFVEAACSRGERALYLTFEESPSQIVRNMRSIGIELQPWIDQGLLEIHAARPTAYGLEMHLVAIYEKVQRLGPSVLVIDPITSLYGMGTGTEPKGMATRLIDHLKAGHVTTILTSLMSSESSESESAISSLADTWIMLSDRLNGRRDRLLRVIKSRGMAHSDASYRIRFGKRGVDLLDPEGHAPEALAPVKGAPS